MHVFTRKPTLSIAIVRPYLRDQSTIDERDRIFESRDVSSFEKGATRSLPHSARMIEKRAGPIT